MALSSSLSKQIIIKLKQFWYRFRVYSDLIRGWSKWGLLKRQFPHDPLLPALSVTWEYWDKEALLIKSQMYSSLGRIFFRLLDMLDKNILHKLFLNLNEVSYTVFYYNFVNQIEKHCFHDCTLKGIAAGWLVFLQTKLFSTV